MTSLSLNAAYDMTLSAWILGLHSIELERGYVTVGRID